MAITFDVASTENHFEQILQLQQRNLFHALTEEQQARQGFVFAEHSAEVLRKMAAHLPQVLAMSDDRVVGYNLAMAASMKEEIPSLAPMFAEFERSTYAGRPLTTYRFVVGGQVCVDEDFRGRGLLGRLYRETAARLPPLYQLCVTEVAARNAVSLKAHQNMGFEVIGTYHDGKELWRVLAWRLESRP